MSTPVHSHPQAMSPCIQLRCQMQSMCQKKVACKAQTPHFESVTQSAEAGSMCLLQIWDAQTRRCLMSMSSHTLAVTSVRWGGDGYIYSSSRDCSVNVWDAQVHPQGFTVLHVKLSCSSVLPHHCHACMLISCILAASLLAACFSCAVRCRCLPHDCFLRSSGCGCGGCRRADWCAA